MAYKVFTNGSVLNASEINDNLMNQSVMVFSTSSTRSAALTSPITGMLTYREDAARYESWNGAAWVDVVDISAWDTWAPVLGGGFTNGNGVWSARYTQIGKTVHFNAEFTSGTTSVYGAGLTVSLPVTAVARLGSNVVSYQRRGATRFPLFALSTDPTFVTLTALNASATYTSTTNISATIPVTWATGDNIAIAGTYEAA